MSTPVSPRMGFEVEILGTRSQQEFADALNQAGIETQAEGYNHRTRHYWKLITDGSCGLELVSPPLEWHQRLILRDAMRILKKAGAQVNETCGFHVHHEWPWHGVLEQADMVARLHRLRGLYRQCKPMLQVLLSPSRWEGNNYCKWESPPDGMGEEDLFNERYVAVNYVSLGRQSTVEFRQHQGTLNPLKALAWAELTRNMVHAASRPDVLDEERINFVFDKLSLSTAQYFIARCKERESDFDRVIGEILAG